MATTQYLFAGFGGQGILFSGKFLAYKGLTEDKQVSWLPSYGPEMRGGTASCSVIISDEPVGSPIVAKPDILVAMNLPSLQKYENDVVSGGIIIVDSTLISKKVERTDVTTYYVPATKIAKDEGFATLANMILMGKLMKASDMLGFDGIEETVKKVVPPKKANLIDINIKALKTGYDFE